MSPDPLLAEFETPKTGDSIEIDVTKAVKSAVDRRQKTISFCVYPEGKKRFIGYASREHEDERLRPAILIDGGG